MPDSLHLRALEPVGRPLVADAVFEQLHRQILSLELPPGAKISEIDVARAMGVSRQPVRDAFYRLSKLGFLHIRPQRATSVSVISERAVFQAQFIRTAIEAETVRVACAQLTEADHQALVDIIEQQREAVTGQRPLDFHALDDLFHKEICERSGHAHAWEMIRENKAHMDRVRFLSLAFASQDAFDDHCRVLEAIRQRDADAAVAQMRSHLARIRQQLERIRAGHMKYFAHETGEA
ncbi:GntR family transcriptional regulator [Pannonibacter phragmitetus]|uniref:Transcriptional regulator, GntR family n=1 Tax=Pannonibacter indicus TaxID=466044 RepID=A0A0K6HPF2_9HYPH|nr:MULTISPECIES: GntR family transcriptional regulator [Pannonibacter]KND17397.1 GntR family transcriptional regulator [Pannonibacter phragmitetus]CUA92668.1 transcriptional regulator, GntR family [Pannonibacter indicus]